MYNFGNLFMNISQVLDPMLLALIVGGVVAGINHLAQWVRKKFRFTENDFTNHDMAKLLAIIAGVLLASFMGYKEADSVFEAIMMWGTRSASMATMFYVQGTGFYEFFKKHKTVRL